MCGETKISNSPLENSFEKSILNFTSNHEYIWDQVPGWEDMHAFLRFYLTWTSIKGGLFPCSLEYKIVYYILKGGKSKIYI